jgi:hypothetical protein
MHVTERIWSPRAGELKDAIVVEDPKAFTRPWTTTKTYYRRPTWEEVENDTSQNDRALPTAGEHVSVSASELAALESATTAPASATASEHRAGTPLKVTDIEALQKASEQGGINQAWESIEITYVQVSAGDIKWIGGSRFTKYNCMAQPDGTTPYCEKSAPPEAR